MRARMKASPTRMMRRMKYQGRIFFVGVVDGVERKGGAMVTSCSRQTPNPGTTNAHPAAIQFPPLSVVVELQLKHCPSPPPEHVAHPDEHVLHVPEAVSKYWLDEQVRTQVDPRDLTGREGGQVRHVSNLPLHVAQSG